MSFLITALAATATTLTDKSVPAVTDAAPSALGSFTSMIGGLVVVLALIFVLAYVVRRFNLAPSTNNVLKTVAVAPLGQKEKVVLMEVNGKQYLLGVTPQQVNLIEKIEDPIEVKAESFASKLRQAKANSKMGSKDAPV